MKLQPLDVSPIPINIREITSFGNFWLYHSIPRPLGLHATKVRSQVIQNLIYLWAYTTRIHACATSTLSSRSKTLSFFNLHPKPWMLTGLEPEMNIVIDAAIQIHCTYGSPHQLIPEFPLYTVGSLNNSVMQCDDLVGWCNHVTSPSIMGRHSQLNMMMTM